MKRGRGRGGGREDKRKTQLVAHCATQPSHVCRRDAQGQRNSIQTVRRQCKRGRDRVDSPSAKRVEAIIGPCTACPTAPAITLRENSITMPCMRKAISLERQHAAAQGGLGLGQASGTQGPLPRYHHACTCTHMTTCDADQPGGTHMTNTHRKNAPAANTHYSDAG